MEAVKILEKAERIDWEYDEEADVLYLSMNTPAPALGIDIGDGVILRYDEPNREITGVTILGMRARLLQRLEMDGKKNGSITV